MMFMGHELHIKTLVGLLWLSVHIRSYNFHGNPIAWTMLGALGDWLRFTAERSIAVSFK